MQANAARIVLASPLGGGGGGGGGLFGGLFGGGGGGVSSAGSGDLKLSRTEQQVTWPLAPPLELSTSLHCAINTCAAECEGHVT